MQKNPESDIKHISKAMREFNKIDPEYSSLVYQSKDSDLFISKLEETSAESLGLSLNEFKSYKQ